MTDADLFFPTALIDGGEGDRKRRDMMAMSTSTESEIYGGVSQGPAWLSTGKPDVPGGVGSGSEAQGWHDASVAAIMFNIECNDSYVAAFLMNLRGGGRH